VLIGGPLIIEGKTMENDVQVGVVSWGTGCAAPGYPGEFDFVVVMRIYVFDLLF
jgi:secreted trypsin-like serine protease